MKKIILSLLITPAIYGMSVEKVNLSKGMLAALKKFHEATSSHDNSKRPNIQNFLKPGRFFIAKMDSFGIDRYFSFRTNEDVDVLVEGVRRGGGMKVEWFYCDLEDKETIIIQQPTPNKDS